MIYLLILQLLFAGVKPVETPVNEQVSTNGDSLFIPVLNYKGLKPLLHKENDTTYLVNFWATWCGPCMAELPYFLEVDSMMAGKPFKLLLVSLDFKKDYIRKLQPFVQSKKLEDNVVVLEDNDANFWINDIDPTWGGAIPATLIFKGKQRAFYEHVFHDAEELNNKVKPFINQ